MAKELTVREMASMGGRARAKAHSKAQLRKWGKEGGRPASLDRKALARLEALLRRGQESSGVCQDVRRLGPHCGTSRGADQGER